MHEDGQQEDDPKNYKTPRASRVYVPGLIVGVVVVVALTAGLVMGHDLNIRRQTDDLADQSAQGGNILVEKVGQTEQSRTLDLPATIHGYIETSIYAKVPGYLKTIKVDKGDRVKKGQVLAILDSPETDQQVANARANYRIAAITDERYQVLVRQQVAPQQSADQTHATMLQDKATLDQESSDPGLRDNQIAGGWDRDRALCGPGRLDTGDDDTGHGGDADCSGRDALTVARLCLCTAERSALRSMTAIRRRSRFMSVRT